MRRTVLILLLGVLLSGCMGLPTLGIAPTTLPPTATVTPTAKIIQIAGNVYVRDDQGKVIGWLYNGDQVQATCWGSWCQIFNGNYSGYRFWRGCSSDNPDKKSCLAR